MERPVAQIVEANALNPYERGILRGLQTRGAKAVKLRAISEAVACVMDSTVVLEGTELSVAEALAIKVVGNVLADPKTSSLKDLATIMGDVGPVKVEFVSSAVDEELARAALGEEVDD